MDAAGYKKTNATKNKEQKIKITKKQRNRFRFILHTKV